MADSIEGRFASIYDSLFGVILAPLRRYTAQIIHQYNSHCVIDLGCGTGDQCIQAQQHNPDVAIHGIDSSPGMIAVAQKKSQPEISYQVGDSRATGFETNQFDCAIISLVLHAQSREDRHQMLREAHRIVTDTGILIISDFGHRHTWKGLLPQAVVYVVESFALDDHRRNYHLFRREGALQACIARENLPIVESKGFYYHALQTIVVRNAK